jgi:hypothetical protein
MIIFSTMASTGLLKLSSEMFINVPYSFSYPEMLLISIRLVVLAAGKDLMND